MRNNRQSRGSIALYCALSFVAITAGITLAYGTCTWTWEEDSCLDVLCPSGCFQWGHGPERSSCKKFLGDLCCNCWYRERLCRYNGTSTPCYRAAPPAPNTRLWECVREDSAGPCDKSDLYGYVCLATGNPPWGTDD